MEKIDTKILDQLKNNGREPFLKIAKKLNVSEGTIRQRVAKLIKNKTIKKFTVELENATLAIVGIQIMPGIKTDTIIRKAKMLGASRLYEVTGRFDIICFIEMTKMEDLNNILECIRTIDGVEHTETFTVLKEN